MEVACSKRVDLSEHGEGRLLSLSTSAALQLSKEDDQTRIDVSGKDHNNGYWHCNGMFELIVAHLEGGKGFGSAVWIQHGALKCFLTCAHHICAIVDSAQEAGFGEEKNYKLQGETMVVYTGRVGDDMSLNKVIIDSMIPHPKYKGRHNDGYDIAVLTYRDENVTKVDSFPRHNFGEGKSLRNDLWIERPIAQKVPGGGVVLLHDFDCSPGNSGSAICFTYDDEENKESALTFAIHTGQDFFEEKHCATVITKDIWIWINDVLDIKSSAEKLHGSQGTPESMPIQPETMGLPQRRAQAKAAHGPGTKVADLPAADVLDKSSASWWDRWCPCIARRLGRRMHVQLGFLLGSFFIWLSWHLHGKFGSFSNILAKWFRVQDDSLPVSSKHF